MSSVEQVLTLGYLAVKPPNFQVLHITFPAAPWHGEDKDISLGTISGLIINLTENTKSHFPYPWPSLQCKEE